MGKKTKKTGGIFSLIGTALIALLFVIGIACFFAVDASGGVTFTATTTLLNQVVGVGTVYKGLGTIFGGSVELGTFSITGETTSEILWTGTNVTLNANIGAIIGLVLFVIGGICLIFFRKNRFGLLIGSILLGAGSVLLFTSGQTFYDANKDILIEATSSKYGTFAYLDIGGLVAGACGIVATLFGLIQTIFSFARH